MPAIRQLISRGTTVLLAREEPAHRRNEITINLLITFSALLFFFLLLAAVVMLVRRTRRRQRLAEPQLPQYNDVNPTGNHKCLTIQTGRQSVVIFNQDGQPMLSNPNSPPHSPDNVPEIHITLPDEQDELGHRKSGRVVVVRVGDGSVGLEPVQEEQLPAYDKEGRSGFYSIDIDQIGGLKEKDRKESV